MVRKLLILVVWAWMATAARAQLGLSAPARGDGGDSLKVAWQTALEENRQSLVKRQENRWRLENWTRKWMVGGQVAVNLLVADNITDHPALRYSSDALNGGFDVWAARFFSRTTGVRLGVGYHRMANRVDNEWVSAWQFSHIYRGNGYYRFGVAEGFADALFDVGGVSGSAKFYPLHVYAVVGVGGLMVGERKMEMKKMDPADLEPHGSVAAWGMLKEYVRDEQGNIVRDEQGRPQKRGEYERFEYLVGTEARCCVALRFGLLFDYRVSKPLSVSLELNVNVADDQLDGIKYAEPFDLPIKLAAGVTWNF